MFVKILEDCRGSNNGAIVEDFAEGDIADVSDELGKLLISEKKAEEAKAAKAPKAAPPAAKPPEGE